MRIKHCLLAFVAALAAAHAFNASAAIYTYTSASGSTNWSAGTNWAPSTPVSSSTNSLVFFGTQVASASVVSNNDSGTFVLNGLTFSGTGPASGTPPTYTISGNPLDFTVASGTATLAINSAGTVKPALVVSNNLVIDATQLLVSQQATTNPFTLTGTISGAGQLALNFASGATGTTTLNANNSFSGGTWIQRGTLLIGTSAFGNSGANSVLGTSGTITMGNGSSSASGIRYTGGPNATDKGILLAATTGTATITVAPAVGDMTLPMSGNVSAANGGAKTISYQNSGSTFLGSYSMSGLITDGTDGSSPVNVTFGGSGKGALTLSNTASTFSGGVSVQGNTASLTYELITAKVGTAGSASPLGSGATIKIGSAANTSTNQLTYNGPGETTNKVIDLQGTTNGATINNLSATGTLTFSSNFTASGAGSKQLTLTGTAGTFGEVAGSILDNSSLNQTSIRKSGNATWYLSGSNGFTGPTNVNQGTLIFGPNALTNSGTIQFTSTGILQYASGNTQDVSAKIQVTGASVNINTNGNNVTFATAFGSTAGATFYKQGLGTLTLAPASGSNTWTAGTVVQQGVLNFSSLGALGSGTIRVSSGTLQYGAAVTDDISSRFTLTAASNGAIDTNGNNVTFANPVASTGTGNGGLIKSGAGSLTLQASSTYSLGTSLLGGSLVAGNVGAFGSGAVTVTAGTLNLGGYSVGNAITMSGGLLSNASNYTGTSNVSGTAAYSGAVGGTVAVDAGGVANFSGSVNQLTVSAGGQANLNDGSSLSQPALTNNGLLAVNNSGSSTLSTAISGSGGFQKIGSGILTVAGNNTYTGATTVNVGGLVLNGSLAVGSNLSVAAAAWLGGSGTAPGTVTMSGTLSPGNSAGVITLGSLVLTSTSVTAIEVASAGTRGTNYDGVSILNASGLTYGGTMSFAFGGSAIAPNTTLDIFSFTGTPSGGFDTLVSTGFYAGTWTNNNNGTFTLVKDSDTLTFSQSTGDVIVVPEPAVTLVGMAGLVASLALRRRRLTRGGTSDAP